MIEVKALVLRAAGINCDRETEYALELAGAEAQRIHINRLIRDKKLLDHFQILVIPGVSATAMMLLPAKFLQTKSFIISSSQFGNLSATAS